MSIIKHVTLQKIVAHDFRYDPRIMKEQCCGYDLENSLFIATYTGVHDLRVTVLQRKKFSFCQVDDP